jgi:putative spermidine/putrescine transport system substrate-binding protein
MIPTTSGIADGAMTRRRWLQHMAASVGVAIGGYSRGGCRRSGRKTLRTSRSANLAPGLNINEISRKAKEDLGFTLTMTALDSRAVVRRAVTQPKSYDIADIEYWMAKKVVPTGVLLPLDAADQVVRQDRPVFITGKADPEAGSPKAPPRTVEFVTGADSAQLPPSPPDGRR